MISRAAPDRMGRCTDRKYGRSPMRRLRPPSPGGSGPSPAAPGDDPKPRRRPRLRPVRGARGDHLEPVAAGQPQKLVDAAQGQAVDLDLGLAADAAEGRRQVAQRPFLVRQAGTLEDRLGLPAGRASRAVQHRSGGPRRAVRRRAERSAPTGRHGRPRPVVLGMCTPPGRWPPDPRRAYGPAHRRPPRSSRVVWRGHRRRRQLATVTAVQRRAATPAIVSACTHHS